MSSQGSPEYLTLAEAAGTLGLSVTTVRRRVKDGSLRSEKVSGPHGSEYRVVIDHTQVRSVAPDYGQDQPPTSVAPIAILERQLQEKDRIIAEKDRRIADLEEGRFQLGGQLGAIMEKARSLEEQVKLLAAPEEKPKRRWWWPF